MITRVLASSATAILIAVMASLPVAGQTTPAPPLVITAHNGGAPTKYAAPRMPWGDPDIQGTWSSDDTEGIPRERPPALGTQLYQSDQEYAARARQVEANVSQFTVDDPVTYEKPFTISFPLTPLDGGGLLPYDCHEGNHAVLQSLGAERAEDRALAADLERGVIRPRRGVQESGPGGGGNRGRGAGAAAPAPATRDPEDAN